MVITASSLRKQERRVADLVCGRGRGEVLRPIFQSFPTPLPSLKLEIETQISGDAGMPRPYYKHLPTPHVNIISPL